MDDLIQTGANLIAILLGLVGVVGAGYFIWGAMLYITAAGAPTRAEQGKSTMMMSLAGVVLALLGFGVVELIMSQVVTGGLVGSGGVVAPNLPDPQVPGSTP